MVSSASWMISFIVYPGLNFPLGFARGRSVQRQKKRRTQTRRALSSTPLSRCMSVCMLVFSAACIVCEHVLFCSLKNTVLSWRCQACRCACAWVCVFCIIEHVCTLYNGTSSVACISRACMRVQLTTRIMWASRGSGECTYSAQASIHARCGFYEQKTASRSLSNEKILYIFLIEQLGQQDFDQSIFAHHRTNHNRSSLIFESASR